MEVSSRERCPQALRQLGCGKACAAAAGTPGKGVHRNSVSLEKGSVQTVNSLVCWLDAAFRQLHN